VKYEGRDATGGSSGGVVALSRSDKLLSLHTEKLDGENCDALHTKRTIILPSLKQTNSEDPPYDKIVAVPTTSAKKAKTTDSESEASRPRYTAGGQGIGLIIGKFKKLLYYIEEASKEPL
jgi:hypothetical protein